MLYSKKTCEAYYYIAALVQHLLPYDPSVSLSNELQYSSVVGCDTLLFGEWLPMF
jgi:hypothetical protein